MGNDRLVSHPTQYMLQHYLEKADQAKCVEIYRTPRKHPRHYRS